MVKVECSLCGSQKNESKGKPLRSEDSRSPAFTSHARLWLGNNEVFEEDLELWFGVEGTKLKGKIGQSRASFDGVLNLLKLDRANKARGQSLEACQQCYKYVNPTDPAENRLRIERNKAIAASELATVPLTRTNTSLQLEIAGWRMRCDSLVSELESARCISEQDNAALDKVRKHLGCEDLARGIKNSEQRDRDRKKRILMTYRPKVKSFEDLNCDYGRIRKSS